MVERYLTYLHEKFQEKRLFQRMNYLHENISSPLPTELIEEYEYIDVELCNIMQKAEEHCSKFKMGSILWSPQYKKTRDCLEYWLQRRSYKLGLHTNVKALITLQRKAGIHYHPNMTLQDINK